MMTRETFATLFSLLAIPLTILCLVGLWWAFGKRRRAPMTDWSEIEPDTGEPVHLRMGLTEDGQGPADPPDPDFDHWGCWCNDPECPGPPREVLW